MTHEWMGNKDDIWHQQLYSILYEYFDSSDELYLYEDLPLIRLDNGHYSIGSACYFPEEQKTSRIALFLELQKAFIHQEKSAKTKKMLKNYF